MQQLFIDGMLADISENTDVTLSLVSNLLTGAEGFVGNHSLTVKLPSTVHNRNIIEQADKVHGGGLTAYLFHDIEYRRGGVPVIQHGIGRLMSATAEDIEIAITWGVRVAVDALLSADDTINDITTTAAITFNELPQVSAYTDALTDDVFYAALDTVKHEGAYDYFRMRVGLAGHSWDTSNLEAASSYLHPSVRMNWILSQLETKYGVTFDWGTAQADIDTMIVPLISKTPNDVTFNNGYAASCHEPSTWGTMSGNYIRFTTLHYSPIIKIQMSPPEGSLICNTAFKGLVKFSIYFYIDRADLTLVSYPIYKPMYGYRLIFMIGSTEQSCDMIPEDYIIMEDDIVANRVNITATGYLPIEMTVNQALTLRVGCVQNGVYDVNLGGGIHVQGGTIWVNNIIGSENEVQPGQLFPVGGNLPEIKPIDLIKFLCAVTGTFPIQASTPDTIYFKPIADLFDWSRAVDWSTMLLSETERPVALQTEYTINGWAQQNMWRWLEDETVKGNYDGGIDVDNETLEESRDVMTFPFAATDGNNVPMYNSERKWDGDAEDWYYEIDYDECKPRVLHMIEGNTSEAVGTFDMDMAVVIANKYGSLPATMYHPVVITEMIRMNNVQFALVDETKPIYIKQHGAYFALLELTLKGDGIAEAKLLKLTKTED